MIVIAIIAPARAKQDRAMPSAPMMPFSYVLLYLVIMAYLIVLHMIAETWIFVHSAYR